MITQTDSGVRGQETLTPSTSDGDEHEFLYRISGANEGFSYHARVGGNESDRFKVTVSPKPRIQQVRVHYEYPGYTGIPERESELGAGLSALQGTKVRIEAILNTETELASFEFGAKSQKLESEMISGRDGLSWSWTLEPDDQDFASIMLKHRLGESFEGMKFSVESIPDDPPVVTLLSPTRKKLKMREDDQIIMKYEGLSNVSIEVEVDGQASQDLKELLPERFLDDPKFRWEGEAMVYLGSLMDRFQQARDYRLRLKVADNRPEDLSGPGIGFSEWIEVTLDNKAPSLVTQELFARYQDFRKRIEAAKNDVREGKNAASAASSQLKKELLSEQTQQNLIEGRKKFAAAEKKVEELIESVRDTVDAHRSDELSEVARKLSQARRGLENTPLQDTEGGRRSVLNAAIKEADEALFDLDKIRDGSAKDSSKLGLLARLEELAQKQEQLAKQKVNPDAEDAWQREQKTLSERIRSVLKRSPKATAQALKSESEAAARSADEAKELAQAQLKMQAQAEAPTEDAIKALLQKEQELVAKGAEAALAEARKELDPKANELAQATAQTQKAAEELSFQNAKEALSSLKNASAQEDLVQRQQEIFQSLEAIEKGSLEMALASLQKRQADAAEEFANAVKEIPQAEGWSDEFGKAVRESREGGQNARGAAEKQAKNDGKGAAQRNQESARKLEDAGRSLEELAKKRSQRAAALEEKEESEKELSIPAEPMAQAFQNSKAATNKSSAEQQRGKAQEAAENLRQTARQARQALSEGRSANMPKAAAPQEQVNKQPGEQKQGQGPPAEEPKAEFQEAQPDQGVPPNLAKLGISAQDWEKIKASLSSGAGVSASGAIPEDYRELAKLYFNQLATEQ